MTSRTASRQAAQRRPTRRPLVEFSFDNAKKVPRRDLYIRFAFGAGISTAASVIAILLGFQVGGLLLAFPAILPATLTLIEQEESEVKAVEDDVGSVLGATSLAAFAALAWWLLRIAGPAVALPVACVGWLVSSLLLYAGLRAVFGEGRR